MTSLSFYLSLSFVENFNINLLKKHLFLVYANIGLHSLCYILINPLWISRQTLPAVFQQF